MKPAPWSFTHLKTFTTCPRQFQAKYVLKSLPYTESAEQAEGKRAHKAFEDRLGSNKVPLPPKYVEHELYMLEIEARGGEIMTERKVGLNLQVKPCTFFDKKVWWRGVIDVDQRVGDEMFIVDYKTGKKKPEHRQLQEFAIYGIATGASVVHAEFYWTIDRSVTKLTFPANHFGHLLQGHVEDLTSLLEAYKYDQWRPKQNGLCANWCDVLDCEFNGKRLGR